MASILRNTHAAMVFTPKPDEMLELTQRIDRIRRLCADLDSALGIAQSQRDLIAQMKRDAAVLSTKIDSSRQTGRGKDRP